MAFLCSRKDADWARRYVKKNFCGFIFVEVKQSVLIDCPEDSLVLERHPSVHLPRGCHVSCF